MSICLTQLFSSHHVGSQFQTRASTTSASTSNPPGKSIHTHKIDTHTISASPHSCLDASLSRRRHLQCRSRASSVGSRSLSLSRETLLRLTARIFAGFYIYRSALSWLSFISLGSDVFVFRSSVAADVEFLCAKRLPIIDAE